jgi:hypothetical protein
MDFSNHAHPHMPLMPGEENQKASTDIRQHARGYFAQFDV